MLQLLPNLQIVLAAAYLTNAGLAIFLAVSGRRFRGAWLWVIAQSLLALGTVGDTLPPTAPSFLALILGNSAQVAASVFYSHAVWVFRFRRPFPRWLYALIVLQVLSFVLAFNQPYLVRSLIFSVWLSLGPLWTAGLLLWKVERRFWLSNGLTALPFLFLSFGAAARVFFLLDAARHGEINPVSELNAWYVSGAILLSTITLFGYYLMTGIRADQVVRQKDEEIEARNRKLLEAGRAKDLFFGIVAHDLRGPIGASARYVRKHLFGKMTGLEAKYQEVGVLASSLERTNDFLEKLLWWSRSQLEDWLPVRNAIDLSECLGQVVALVQPQAELKQIEIVVPLPPHPPVFANLESVQLILNNLLSNAIKYSFPGQTVHIDVGQDGAQTRLTVVDHGQGMDEATQGRLFKIEQKLTALGTAEEPGSGLGLILAQSLAERNGGRISIESKLGQGTRACLSLPGADWPSGSSLL